MWLLVVILACLDAISPQPLTQQAGAGAGTGAGEARGLIECCPCPGSERAALDALALGSAGPGPAAQPTESTLLDRKTDVDECPCRDGDAAAAADSDGAPSALLPRVLRPLQPDGKPESKNEEVKPLLHPEVDLASSFLETLRDATEEEYQEALARDVARNAVRASENGPGHQVTDTGNSDIITIIVNPKAGEEEDIIISEASNVQESRYAQPLGSLRGDLSQVRSTTPVLPTKRLLRLPKFKSKRPYSKPIDTRNSASEVEERVVSANRGLESLKLKSSTSKLSEFLDRAKSQILESDTDGAKNDFNSRNIPDFRLSSLLKKKNEQIALKTNEKTLRAEHHIFPKISFSSGKTATLDTVSHLDSSTSPSKVHEQISESLSLMPQKFNLKSFAAKDLKKKPVHLKRLLKLRDVELIPNKSKTKISIQHLNLKPLSPEQDIKGNDEPHLTEPSCSQERRSETKIQNISQNNEEFVNIMKDSDFSPSENHPSVIEIEGNISEEHMSDDIPSLELSTTPGGIGDIRIETNHRSGEAHEEFEDFDLDNENDFENHKKEHESLERETGSTSTELIQHSAETHEIDSIELPSEDFLQNEDDDSLIDASNNDFHFITLDNNPVIELKEVEMTPKNNYEFAEFESNRSAYSVPTLKEKMLQKLEDLKDDIAHIKNAKQTYIKSSEIRDTGALPDTMEKYDVGVQTENTYLDINKQAITSSTGINSQSSSSDNLKEHSENQSKFTETSSQELNASGELSANMRDNVEENIDMNPSSSSSETIILDSINLPSETDDNPQLIDNTNQVNINAQLNSNENSLEKTCMAEMDKNVEKKVKDFKYKEMSSQASESIAKIVPQPSERQSIVVQPTSLFGDNSLFRPLPGIPNLLNLDAHLPTLDEISSGLSGILGIGARGADNDDEISAEFQSAEDCSGSMSTGASTKSSKSMFPNKKPLEDINLNIFQLTPKSNNGLFQSRAPSLNLNSYKAKLALPQNLDLKPLRLESSLGKNGNLLGATLTFGPERVRSGKSRLSRPKSILDHARVPALRSSLPNLPDLDDIKTSMRARAEDLLSSPLSVAPSQAVQKVSEITNNLRSHTENTVKNFQQTLASTLSQSKVGEIPLRAKIANHNPEDLLEKLSTAREDMSDKLKALHADFADRLSSIHENIAERTTLPTLQLPLFTPINRNSNPKFRSRPKSYGKPKASVSNMRSNKAGASNLRSSTSQGTGEIKVRPFKISKAASTLNPKAVEIPKLITTSSKPPFAKPLQRDTNVKIKNSRPFESSITVDKKSIARNNLTPNKNNLSPQNKATIRQQFTNQRTTSRAPSIKDSLRSRANSGSKSRLDSRGFASEVEPSIVPAPVKPLATVTDRLDPIQTQITRSRPKPLFSNQNLGTPSQISTPATKSRNEQVFHKPLPKVSSSPLLSKVRESLSRHSGQAGSPNHSNDMAKSATQNRAIEIKQEPLRENVKYRCRMVCVKEPIE